MSLREQHRVPLPSPSRRSSRLCRLTVLAALTLIGGCDLTSPGPNATGIWAARLDTPSLHDSISLALRVDGAKLYGFAFLYRAPDTNPSSTSFSDVYLVYGTVSGSMADLTLSATDPLGGGVVPRLRGQMVGDQLAGFIDYVDLNTSVLGGYVPAGSTGTNQSSITLARAHPVNAGVTGTWLLTSTTGGPPSATVDTIIVAPEGMAWQHRDGPLLESSAFASDAIWRRRGNWLYLHHHMMPRGEDSLLVTSSELQRTYGATTEHFTRLSDATALSFSWAPPH
jgi:hypothetical protein